jgi:hypothetical protein
MGFEDATGRQGDLAYRLVEDPCAKSKRQVRRGFALIAAIGRGLPQLRRRSGERPLVVQDARAVDAGQSAEDVFNDSKTGQIISNPPSRLVSGGARSPTPPPPGAHASRSCVRHCLIERPRPLALSCQQSRGRRSETRIAAIECASNSGSPWPTGSRSTMGVRSRRPSTGLRASTLCESGFAATGRQRTEAIGILPMTDLSDVPWRK